MSREYPSTPLWVKLTISALIAAAMVWWITEREDRRGNEQRLSAIASRIAGRAVRVSCPGPIGRLIGWDIVEGSVRFDADGKPRDETKIRRQSCRSSTRSRRDGGGRSSSASAGRRSRAGAAAARP